MPKMTPEEEARHALDFNVARSDLPSSFSRTAATLRTLASLHDEGLLTDEEYAAKRAEVISRI
jgi:Short C-terminal domain